MNRRQAIQQGIGASAALAGLSAGCQRAASVPTVPAALPDRSQSAPSLPVAIQRCKSYESAALRATLDAALDLIGGLEDLIRGKRVTVKLNLTGLGQPCCGLPAGRTYQTHENLVAVLCAALCDAGAQRILLVESFYFLEPTKEALPRVGFGIDAIEAAGQHRVEFVNTRNRGAYPDYTQLRVPEWGLMFPAYHVHRAYGDADVFISLAKLKEHGEAGVTCAAKNLFGITPQALYGSDAPNENSVTARVKILHQGTRPAPAGVAAAHDVALPGHPGVSMYRVPRIIADLVRARPVDLAIVDGIETIAGGAGPWETGLKRAMPGVLVVGRNVVCADTVCAAVMGYDGAAAHGVAPFPGENHLGLLAQAGVGTNDIGRIDVRGVPVAEAQYPFRESPKGNADTPADEGAHAVEAGG